MPGKGKPFEKGHPGKKKGTKGKRTLILNTFAEYIVEGGMEKFQTELNKLTGKDYVQSYLAIFEYVKPKLARQEVKSTGGTTNTVKIEYI